MTENKIEPHRVTKPIQLLAAWLVGLVLTNGSFLAAAIKLDSGTWERSALIVASIANVPVFLLALFLLQTRFRAELQEDAFYADYLSKKTAAPVRIDKNTSQDIKIEELERTVLRLASVSALDTNRQDEIRNSTRASQTLDWSEWSVALNEYHPKFTDVRTALRGANIPLTTIFGSKTEVLPTKWIISLSNHLPTTHRIAILRAVLPFGFDGFEFWEPIREAEEDEDVYIGSYGDGSYARVTEQLATLLEGELEAVDLNHYYKQHKVPRKS